MHQSPGFLVQVLRSTFVALLVLTAPAAFSADEIPDDTGDLGDTVVLEALSIEAFKNVTIDSFEYKDVTPEEALFQLCEKVKEITGRRVRMVIREPRNPQAIKDRVLLHRRISGNFSKLSAGEILRYTMDGARWHWEEKEGAVIVNAWHKPQTD